MLRIAKVKSAGALLALLGICAFSGTFTYSALAGRETVRSPQARPTFVRVAKAPAPRDKTKKPADLGSTEPAGVPLVARLVGAKDSYTLDLGGKSAEDFRKQIENLGKGPRRPGRPGQSPFPASPKVDLKLELTNTGKEEIKVQARGNANKLTLDLKGPGVLYAPVLVQNFLPLRRPPVVLTLAPGETVTLTDVPTLAIPKPGTGSQAYWTAPGQYTLTVDYILGVSPAPEKTKDMGEGFGEVTIHSAPIKLKVVEEKK